jgi:hypothetical protein
MSILKWFCSEEAAALGELLKGIGLTGITIMAWVWLIEWKRWRG